MVYTFIVFDLVDNTGFVIECSAMSCKSGVRMEVRYEHVAAGRADTAEFSISRNGIAEMAENKPTPYHVKLAGREWHLADVSGKNCVQASRCEHLGT
jgi:hypothetical protein